MTINSPSNKKIKLEDDNDTFVFADFTGHKGEVEVKLAESADHEEDQDDMNADHCSICLQPISDRTLIPACSHEFCFECLLVWTG